MLYLRLWEKCQPLVPWPRTLAHCALPQLPAEMWPQALPALARGRVRSANRAGGLPGPWSSALPGR